MASPILFIILLVTTLPLSMNCSKGFSTNLMHRDSPSSPYHNPSLSRYDRLRAAARRSIARANHFRTYTNVADNATPNNNSISLQPELTPDGFEYLMAVSIGTPPLEILAIADTGSDLIWTQCKPCDGCYEQTDPIFDPNNSSSYSAISCTAAACSPLPQNNCGTNSLCGYHYSYGDGSTTVGVLSSESFTFDSAGDRTVQVPNISFGCSHSSRGTFLKSDGIVGLGGGPLSLVSQLGPSINYRFSYCLTLDTDETPSTSQIKFGDDATVNGPNVVSTPLIAGPVDTFYLLSLEGIDVGDETVNIAAGNIIIDSGTFLTILDDSMMNPLIDKLSQVVEYPRVNDPDKNFDFCVDVSNSTGPDLDVPDLTFQFRGAPVQLVSSAMFVEVDERVLCLGIVSTGQVGGIRIFGNLAQQNLHVGYDLGARKLSFAPADCSEL